MKKIWQDWKQFIFVVLIVLVILCGLICCIRWFFSSDKNKNDMKINIKATQKMIDSLSESNQIIRNTNQILEQKLKIQKSEEKIIIQKIYENEKKVENIRNIPTILPDTSNYRFFTEFETVIEIR